MSTTSEEQPKGTRVGAPFPKWQLREYPPYKPINTIAETSGTAIFTTFLGLALASIKGSLTPSTTLLGGLKANSRLIWLAPSVVTPFVFVNAVSTNLREKNSPLNTFYAGAASGAVLGAATRQLSKSFGFAFLLGFTLSALDLFGYPEGLDKTWFTRETLPRLPEDGEKQTRYQILYRRPLSQTIEELGDHVRPFK